MSYITGTDYVSEIKFNPDYFRRSALDSAGMDRRSFLQRELVNLQAAIYQYQRAALELMQRGAYLDGVSDVGKWMTTIGSTVGTVATGAPVVSVIGWVVAGAGVVVNVLEKKKDQKAARDLQTQAQRLQLEAQQIQDYYTRYNNELQLIKLRPAIFGAVVGIIALNRR